MARRIERVARSIESMLKVIRHNPNVIAQFQAAAEASDNEKLVAALKRYLGQIGINPDEALTINPTQPQPSVSVYQSGVDQYGQTVGIRLTVTLEQ